MGGRCWDRFEARFVIYYTGYSDRVPIMERELDRVGLICDKIWQFPNPIDPILMARARQGNAMKRNVATFNLAHGHYKALKAAFCRGAQNVLVVEDDARFLLDTNEIESILSAAPADWDVLLLDPTAPKKMPEGDVRKSISDNRVGDGPWVRFTNMRSTGCYAMSRKAMRQWCDLFEGGLSGRNPLMPADRQYANMPCSRYLANPAISVQEMTRGWGTNTPGISDVLKTMYRNCFGLDLSKYNIGAS